ncbi:hypothetical protein QQ008_28175 [Fulvivirgaceae bacterium BMA10]|uniref:DUF6970 domain-containing protein n=1 Tax=Splendidivirga corallicola TaxID=3051826 RepID=A0ABT8KWZ2_9BACT|nr:hypothetical protein [Fulvivirgaceae bacterium BMA10]
MKKLTIFILGITFAFYGCKKEDLSKEIPSCIQESINQIAAGEVWNPPAKVYSFTYDNQTVYYFPPRCCDIPSLLYDKDCNLICAPDGGFTGRGDGKCPDFGDLAADQKLIWEDDRN